MKIERLGIRKQVLYLVLGCSIITLFIAGAIAIFGMFNIKSNAVNISEQIGEKAAADSSKALKDVSLKSLQGLTHERSKQIELFFENNIWDVTVLSNQMNRILSNPQNYNLRHIDEPDKANNGVIVSQLQYKEGADRAALANEVGLTANLDDFLIRLYDNTPNIGSVYVTSKNGFTIIADSVSAARVDANNVPIPVDNTVRPWYKKAVQENKLIFTDVFIDAQGRGLAVACAAPYYDQNGEIAGVVGEGRTLKVIEDIVNTTEIGKTGFAFILNKEGKVIFSPHRDGSDISIDSNHNLENDSSLFYDPNEMLAETAKKMAAGEIGIALLDIDGKSCYLAYEPLEGTDWSFGTAIEASEVTLSADSNKAIIEQSSEELVDTLNSSIKFMILAMIAAFIAIVALVPFMGRKIADTFTKPIMILTDGVREIASGNLDKKIDIQTGNEIEHLAICFNAMTDELKTYMNNLTKITAEKERIATELDVAKSIQTGMLPNIFPPFPNRKEFDIYATMNAAKEVGGDFYDFYLLDENHLIVTIADVSGKGIPAALFMMMSKTILKNFAMSMRNPDDLSAVMNLSNNQLCQSNDAMMFVTVFMGMLNLKTGEFTFVNGGHNPPLIYRKSTDQYEYLKVDRNFVLGGMDDLDFSQQKIKLEHGDKIFMYTDGVTEALNKSNELYGDEKLIDCLNRSDRNSNVEELLAFVRADVESHVDGAAQSDDITMLILKLNQLC